jgi:hypothetical protein
MPVYVVSVVLSVVLLVQVSAYFAACLLACVRACLLALCTVFTCGQCGAVSDAAGAVEIACMEF